MQAKIRNTNTNGNKIQNVKTIESRESLDDIRVDGNCVDDIRVDDIRVDGINVVEIVEIFKALIIIDI